MSTWVSIENGVRRQYTPTPEELQDMQEAFGKPAPLTEVAAQSFLHGIANGIGFSGAQSLHSYISSNAASPNNLSGREIAVCKNHDKIKKSDVDRIASQVHNSEQHLAQLEAAKNQAIDLYKAALAKALDNTSVSVEISPNGMPVFSATIDNPGTAVFFDIPAVVFLKQQEQNACAAYNAQLLVVAQQKAALGHIQRQYAQPDESFSGKVAISVVGGVFSFIICLFSSSF